MFRYRDSQGLEKRVINEAALADAIRAGEVLPTTPLAEGVDGGWGLAARHPAFARAHQSNGLRGRVAMARAAGGWTATLMNSRLLAAVTFTVVVLVAGGFTLSHIRERALAEQRHAYATALLGFAAGRLPAPELLAAEPSTIDDPALRTLWVRLQVAHTIWRSIDSAQARFGVEGFLPPEDWMSDEYVMNARAFPAVGDHWSGYVAWDRTWSPHAEDLLWQENARRARDARMTERETFELIDPAQPGLSAVGWDLELRRRFASEAMRLHTTLVESRGNVFLSEGAWWFADTRTQRAYGEHVSKLQRIASELQENATRRASALGIEPGDGVVPAGVARIRPAGG